LFEEGILIKSFVRTVDGLYAACAIRKPAGDGPFPAIVFFHGAPGGRGMEYVIKASENPCTQRFLKEGYVFVQGDWREAFPHPGVPVEGYGYNGIDDAVSIIRYTMNLPYVDPLKVGVWGYSSGGAIVLEAIGRIRVAAAVSGAPASFGILGLKNLPRGSWEDKGILYREIPGEVSDEDIDRDKVISIIDQISCPLFIYHGSDDFLLPMNRWLFQLIEESGKKIEIRIYEGENHGSLSCSEIGGKEPLEHIVKFFNKHLKMG